MFELFDPQCDLRITVGNLPHWFQPGVTYFVTFRTEDSLPKQVADLWYRRRGDWLRRHGIDPKGRHWKAALQLLSAAKQNEFHQTFSEEYLALLDKGYGECVLGRQELAQIVASTLTHFDGERYHLADFIVMPNHVHLLVCLLGTTEIENQCFSWKKYSAGQINSALRREGRFWQEESFDHLVRSPDHFAKFQEYIVNNGANAGLSPASYLVGRGKNAPSVSK